MFFFALAAVFKAIDFYPPLDLVRNGGLLYGFGLDFHVHVCVRNHISDMYGPILFVLVTKTTHDARLLFFRDQIQDGRLAAIFLLKCVPNHFSDMHDPILLKLGASTVHDAIHMQLTLFCDLIKDG